jgi:hypothetical protein
VNSEVVGPEVCFWELFYHGNETVDVLEQILHDNGASELIDQEALAAFRKVAGRVKQAQEAFEIMTSAVEGDENASGPSNRERAEVILRNAIATDLVVREALAYGTWEDSGELYSLLVGAISQRVVKDQLIDTDAARSILLEVLEGISKLPKPSPTDVGGEDHD